MTTQRQHELLAIAMTFAESRIRAQEMTARSKVIADAARKLIEQSKRLRERAAEQRQLFLHGH